MLRRPAAHLLRDPFDRALDDLDLLRLRVATRELARESGQTSFALVSSDGVPILGFHDGTSTYHRVTALHLRMAPESAS